jgi:hypothetical protein
MRKARGGMTAGELLAQQAADPHYHAAHRAKDRKLAEIVERRRREQRALLDDLAAAGVVVDWVGRLLELPSPDQRTYPVLLDHITKPYSPWLSEWIGRAFGQKAARPLVWDLLVHRLEAGVLPEHAAQGVFAAISTMARPGDLHTLIELLSNPQLGPGRIYLIGNLMRSKRKEARDALVQCQGDPDLAKEISARLLRARN